MRAAAQARIMSGTSGASSPCPFKRCSFSMTPVRDSGCALTVECYVRLYAGSQRPVTGGELLLEPSAILPGTHSAPRRPCCTTETQTDASELQAKAQAGTVQPGKEAAKKDVQILQELEPIQTRVEASAGAFFPAEIRVGNAAPSPA